MSPPWMDSLMRETEALRRGAAKTADARAVARIRRIDTLATICSNANSELRALPFRSCEFTIFPQDGGIPTSYKNVSVMCLLESEENSTFVMLVRRRQDYISVHHYLIMRYALVVITILCLAIISSCTEEEWHHAICSGDTSEQSWTEYLAMKAYCWGKGAANEMAESAVDYKATKDKAQGFGALECGAGKDYYIAGTCMSESEFDSYFGASSAYSGKGGCKHPTPFYISDGAFGEKCVGDIAMRTYLQKSGTISISGTQTPSTPSGNGDSTPPQPTEPECTTASQCPSYCRGTSMVVSQTCSSGKCVDTGTNDCTRGGRFTTCIDTGAGAACSQQKQCEVSSDCGDGRVSVCASEGGSTKYTYNCNAQFACETFVVNCPADFGAGSVCRNGGCTNP